MTPDRPTVARTQDDPWTLLMRAMGTPREFREKLGSFVNAVSGYGNSEKVEARLQRLKDLGHIDVMPTRNQRIVGAIDMLRFFIVPCAADYYRSKGINFHFHSLLRMLDDPTSIIDPTGFNSSRDAIIGHVMQVVHANPHYDFELLDSFPDGMEQMEQQVRQILTGTHPRSKSILAIVEDPDYHARLLAYVQAFRSDPTAAPLLRENITGEFELIEKTFGSLHNAMRYFAKLPRTLRGGLRHVVRNRTFPRRLAVTEPLHPPRPTSRSDAA